MDQKQTEEMDKLASNAFLNAPVNYYNSIDWFINGYKAAQNLDQIILNPYVRDLLEAIEMESEILEKAGVKGSAYQLKNILRPFKEEDNYGHM